MILSRACQTTWGVAEDRTWARDRRLGFPQDAVATRLKTIILADLCALVSVGQGWHVEAGENLALQAGFISHKSHV